MSLDIYKDSSFIKVLREPNSSKLLIPNEFVSKYGEILPQEAFLMTEEEYGKCWRVKITRFEDGRFCFENGWPEFVVDNQQICASDFVLFKLVDASTFQVSIFGKDGLKKPSSTSSRRPPSTPQADDAVNNRRGKRPVDCSSSRRTPSTPQDELNNRRRENPIEGQTSESEGEIKSFTIVLAAHHWNCLNIPMDFASKNEIALRSNIMLQNENGESWEVKVFTLERKGERVCVKGVDWKNYWESNNLVLGNELTFSIVGDDFGTLHVSREGLITPCVSKKKTASSPRKFL